jgi:hypothetical protein
MSGNNLYSNEISSKLIRVSDSDFKEIPLILMVEKKVPSILSI